MIKSLLTYDLLTRFEHEYITENYTEKQERRIVCDAKAAMFNRHYHYEHGEEWTDEDIFKDFLRILKISKIDVVKRNGLE